MAQPIPVNGITCICAWEPCSKPFLAFPSAVKAGKKYCSSVCHNLGAAIARMRRVTLICAYAPCSQSFDVVPSASRRGTRYCSRPCAELASRHRKVDYTTLTCAYEPCGKLFEVSPSRLKEAKFCSRQCQTVAITAQRWPETLEERFWNKVAKRTDAECWLWQGSVLNSGYGQCQIHIDGALIVSTAHGASWLIHHKSLPPKPLQVLHNCPEGRDNPLCVNPAHLWIGTQTDNMMDCVSKGRNGNVTHPERLARGDRSGLRLHPERAPRGERNANAKISDAQWQEALALYATGEWTQTRLAQRYGVNQTSISARLKRQR